MKESQRLSLHSGAAMVDLNPRFIVAARCNASHVSDMRFPSSCVGFSQKNMRLYTEMLTLTLGQYYF